jgi:hypothetical protein
LISQGVHNDKITSKHQAKIEKNLFPMTKNSSSLRYFKRIVVLAVVVSIAGAVYIFSNYEPAFTAQPVSKEIAHDTLLP